MREATLSPHPTRQTEQAKQAEERKSAAIEEEKKEKYKKLHSLKMIVIISNIISLNWTLQKVFFLYAASVEQNTHRQPCWNNALSGFGAVCVCE